MNWDFCLVCQASSREQLRSTDQGLATLSKLLPEFAKLGKFNIDKFGSESNNQESLVALFQTKKAVYHKNCLSKYNQQKLDRCLKTIKNHSKEDQNNETISAKRTKRNAPSSSIDLRELKCLFCFEADKPENLSAAGTLHATEKTVDKNHVMELTEKIKSQAISLGKLDIASKLSTGDVITNEIFYHKSCKKQFENNYRDHIQRTKNINSSVNVSTEEFNKAFAFNKIVCHIQEEISLGCNMFEVLSLETMYKDQLEYHDIPYSSHVSRFSNRLELAVPQLEKRIIGKKTFLCVSSDVNEFLKEEIEPNSFVKTLSNLVAPIREDMAKVRNSFNGDFSVDSQQNSIPIRLLSLCSMLIDGFNPKDMEFSQPALSVSQLIMLEYKKNNNTTVTAQRRHQRYRETPLPLYVGLKLYASVRSKTLINRLFHLGLCVSYERCLEVCNDLSVSLLDKYNQKKVFVANTLKLELFTIIAKDNIDLNATSTKITKHFHGISMTTMQFPTKSHQGKDQEISYDFDNLHSPDSRRLNLPKDYTCPTDVPFDYSSSLYAPLCTINIDYLPSLRVYNTCKKDEYEWLESVNKASKENCFSWSSFHSFRSEKEQSKPIGINAMMPLIDEKVSSVKSQFHCMKIIKDTIAFLNPLQTPVDVSDQPVFAFSKEIQFRDPTNFGSGLYTCMLGDLHLEHSMLIMHGEIIQGSGLEYVLYQQKLSTAGTSSIVDANDIKRSRYCLQVTLCAIYNLLKDAHQKSESCLSPIEWLDERSKTSEMAFYWKLILHLQINILVFVRSIRQGNFHLYCDALFNMLKWYFALDKYNYARWATIYWFDMVSLHLTCPDVYNEFMKGNFSYLKTKSSFSQMGLDQLHEQNNKYIKSVSGATSLVNRQNDAALIRWELSGPELSRLLVEFEENCMTDRKKQTENLKHHEDNSKFCYDFFYDVKKVTETFICNPFELGSLQVINKADAFVDDNIFYNISRLETIGSEKLHEFIQQRLIFSKIPISMKITKNHFILMGDESGKKNVKKPVDSRLNLTFFTKLRSAITYRRDLAAKTFSEELFGVAQCLSIDEKSLYHGNKADILKRFPKVPPPEIHPSSALIVELSAIFRIDMKCKTFADFAKNIYEYIIRIGKNFDRIDVICDRYFESSFKLDTRDSRGSGSEMIFDRETAFPSDFNVNFLKNSKNKEKLNNFLAIELMELHNNPKSLTITKGNSILSNNPSLMVDASINYCSSEEADQKLVRHMMQCVKIGVDTIIIKTVDTDVLLLLVAFRYYVDNFDSKVYAWFGTGKNKCYYDINSICLSQGRKVSHAIPFFHAFSGCDSTSSFFNQGKCKLWDKWNDFPSNISLTKVFAELSSKPTQVTDEQLDILEKFVLFVYYPKLEDNLDINVQRMHDFEYSTHNNLRLIPPSKNGLKEHIKRCAYVAGWIFFQCVSNVSLPDPEQWGWNKSNMQFYPKWQDVRNPTDPLSLTSTCSCTSAKCLQCTCSKKAMRCITYCKCRRKCLYASI